MEKLKVLVVDDSIVYRKILTTAVNDTEIAFTEKTASNGKLAIERLNCGVYDTVLMDVNMPEMDGIEALKIIKEKWPKLPIIMVSDTSGKNKSITIKALESGAMDFIVKPLDEYYEKNMEMIKNKLKLLFAQIQLKVHMSEPIKIDHSLVRLTPKLENKIKTRISKVDLVLIASSTGGPAALEKIFGDFKEEIKKPILIVQHMPPGFTKVMAESLDKKNKMRFIEGKYGDVIRSGQVIIAPGGYHMVIADTDTAVKTIDIINGEYVNGVRPSADVLFRSVAQEYKGAMILAVILTGMGCDGKEGLRELKNNCKCYCITQSERSCVVYGMPKCTVEAGFSDEVVDINEMAQRIKQIIDKGS